MRHLIILLMVFIINNFSYSQTHEIGGFVGGSNFIGDVGSTKYIAPNQPAFGAIYKWNRSPRHAFRFSAIATNLEGIDGKSDDVRRRERGYSFNTSIIELSAGIEFTFVDFNLHEDNGRSKSTPYIYSGIAYSNVDNYYYNTSGVRINENTSSNVYAIPIVLGYKTTFTEKIIAALEIGARYTFSDELDGSSPDSSQLDSFSIGNVNNNDWYMFTGLTLTVTFGRKPCFCIF